MAKITTEQARKLTNNTSNGFFNLKNDGDSANVRFMYDKVSDIETFAVHDVKIDGRTKHIDCLNDAEGNGNCPFCEKGFRRTARTFFKLYNIDKNAVEIWDCGIKRAPAIENMLAMSQAKQLVNGCYEIIRHGEANSTDTTYELRWKGNDDVTLADLPEIPDLYGKYVLKKTPEEMEYYITNNKFQETAKDNKNSIKPRNNGRVVF